MDMNNVQGFATPSDQAVTNTDSGIPRIAIDPVSKTTPMPDLSSQFLMTVEEANDADAVNEKYSMANSLRNIGIEPFPELGADARGVTLGNMSAGSSDGSIGNDITKSVFIGADKGASETLDAAAFIAGAPVELAKGVINFGLDAVGMEPVKNAFGDIESMKGMMDSYKGFVNDLIPMPDAIVDWASQPYDNETLGTLIETITQFSVAAVPAAKMVKAMTTYNPVARGMIWGAIADFTAFDPDDPTITNVITEHLEMAPPEERDAVLQAFMSQIEKYDTDGELMKRAKTALEGGIIGGVVEGAIKTARLIPFGQIIDGTKRAIGRAGDAADARIAERQADTSVTLGAGVDPMPMIDEAISAAGTLVRPKETVKLGTASDAPKVATLAPQYRVTLQEGYEITGNGKQALVKKAITPKNFEQAATSLDEIAARFPDPLASKENWALMNATMQNSTEVPMPPNWLVETSNDPTKFKEWFGTLTDDQITAAGKGLAVQKKFVDAYKAGAPTELTGQLMLWSILSRRLSAFPHEGGYLNVAEAAMPFIQKAARGEWSQADTDAWKKMVPKIIPAGSPGKSATSNVNAFGETFLRKMSVVDENGVSALTRLHNMIADPNMSGAQIRRAYYGLAEATGIKNKILSFALLVSGRNDVVVLDRIQINRMWAGGEKIYDDIYQLFDDAQGLGQYEALERSLAPRIKQLYADVGRPDDASVGRYHWESWVLSSGQIVSHPTLEAVVKTGAPTKGSNIPPTALTPVREGRFHTTYSNVAYETLPNGKQRFTYETSDGTPYHFTKSSLDAMFDEALKKKSGVLPDDFPGVAAFEGGSYPWYEFEGVDRGRLDEFIRSKGKAVREQCHGACCSVV